MEQNNDELQTSSIVAEGGYKPNGRGHMKYLEHYSFQIWAYKYALG